MSIRVTQRAVSATMLSNLQRGFRHLERLQDQMSSGKELQRPSDSPARTVSALDFRANLRRTEQLGRNAADAIGWLGTTDTAITSSLELVNRARDLALQGLNGSMDVTARKAVADEIRGISQSMLGLANTTYLDRPVFNGTASALQAFAGAPPYPSTDDTGAVLRNVAPNVTVRVNAGGNAVFGPAGDTVFELLDDIAAALESATPAAASPLLTNLDARATAMRAELVAIGARYRQVEDVQRRNEERTLDLMSALAEVEDIDLPKTMLEVQLQQTSYQAALNVTAKVIQPSLLDFLR